MMHTYANYWLLHRLYLVLGSVNCPWFHTMHSTNVVFAHYYSMLAQVYKWIVLSLRHLSYSNDNFIQDNYIVLASAVMLGLVVKLYGNICCVSYISIVTIDCNNMLQHLFVIVLLFYCMLWNYVAMKWQFSYLRSGTNY